MTTPANISSGDGFFGSSFGLLPNPIRLKYFPNGKVLVCARTCLSKLFFFFRRFCLFFQFGNSLHYPFYSSRVNFTQLWRSNGFPFLSRCKHSTFALTNLAF